jgi:biopolymer transport protein TolR
MASSKLAARAIRNHAKYKGRNDLNIVPMIDMMVILVFFLLFTAVFSNTNILELNLPAPNSSVPELPKGLNLEVIVRRNAIEVADRGTGVLRTLPKKEGEYDFAGLSAFLQDVKARYPTVLAASVLLEQDIPYDVLVQTMDNTRVWQNRVGVGLQNYRIKKHRQRSHGGSHMALVPFIDMLTMLVVFLLLHSSEVEILPNTKNITIPQSIAEIKPRETVVVMVTTEDLLVNGRIIAKVSELRGNDAQLVIEPLRLALKEQADSSLRRASQEDLAEREVTIMGDKGTPFSVLKRVMATATAADYGKVSLAVIQREVEAGGA